MILQSLLCDPLVFFDDHCSEFLLLLVVRSQKPGVKWDLKFMSTEKGQLVMYTNHKEVSVHGISGVRLGGGGAQGGIRPPLAIFSPPLGKLDYLEDFTFSWACPPLFLETLILPRLIS